MKKNRVTKLMAVVGMLTLMTGVMTGCGSTGQGAEAEAVTQVAEENTATQDENTAVQDENAEAQNENAEAQEENAETQEESTETETISGTVTMAGSTSMEKLANALAESFMAKYPDVTVTAEFTGSGAGIESLLAGSVDIGNSSRNLKDEEKTAGAVENIVAIDGIAVVTHPSNTAAGLTTEQLIGIYKGEIKNWSEAGGADEAVVVVGREAGSGTRGAFEELLEIEDACVYANELDSTGAVMAKVAATPGAIGYVSLDVLDDTVKALPLDGVDPTEENIKAGSYLLSRPFVMATKGEVSEQNSTVQALFEYMKSAEGQELIKSVGLILPD